MAKARAKQSGFLDQLVAGLGLGPQPEEGEKLPYCLRRDILSAAELWFWKALQEATTDWAIVCPKVGLVEIFFPKTGEPASNRQYWTRLLPRNVDFLLCDPVMLRPLVGVELINTADRSEDLQARDAFLTQVFEDAGLPLLRLEESNSYDVGALEAELRFRVGLPVADQDSMEDAGQDASADEPANAVPRCPKCGKTMVPQTVRKDGPHFGRKYWACADFPRCRGVREFRSAG